MLKVGIAGTGFMGMVHYLTYAKLRGVKVVAVCDKIKERRDGDWRSIKGNFGPPGKKMDLSGVRSHATLNRLIADEDIDLIDIALPPSLHADTAVKALRSGKHVFCEKPMAMNPRDCQRMTRESARTGKLLMIGHVLPFFAEYAWALKQKQSNKFGRLLGGSFKRVISDPTWLTQYWSAKKIGGPMLDLHIHDAHFIRLFFGLPERVITHGRQRRGLAEHWNTLFDYGPKGPRVQATSGTINQQGKSFDHGFEIHFERATLMFEFACIGKSAGYLCKPTILTQDGKVRHPSLGSGDPMEVFKTELGEVLRSVRRNRPSEILDSALATDAVRICQKQTESLIKRRPVKL